MAEVQMFSNKQLNSKTFRKDETSYELYYDFDMNIHRMCIRQGNRLLVVAPEVIYALHNHVDELFAAQMIQEQRKYKEGANEASVLQSNSDKILCFSGV